MTESHTKAQFWKCALQVNPAGYISYRGTDHGMTEEQYNQKLVEAALENGIQVIGLADHGNVDGVDAIRTAMNQHGILVFPGFEIASTEKAHFVCLFLKARRKISSIDTWVLIKQIILPTECGHQPWRNDLLQKVE